MADKEQTQRPEPANLNTLGEKSREAQNHGSTTSVNSQHNYQTAGATEPNQLAEQAAENRQRFAQGPGQSDAGSGIANDSFQNDSDQNDFRQHDAGQ